MYSIAKGMAQNDQFGAGCVISLVNCQNPVFRDFGIGGVVAGLGCGWRRDGVDCVGVPARAAIGTGSALANGVP